MGKMQGKPKKHKENKQQEAKLPRIATKEEKEKFNEDIRNHRGDKPWAETLIEAAKNNIPPPTTKAKKTWITSETLALIETKHDLEFKGNDTEYKAAKKAAAKAVKNDWETWLKEVTEKRSKHQRQMVRH